MNDTQRIQLAHAAGRRLELLATALDTVGADGLTVMARLRDLQGNLRAKSYENAPAARHDATFAGLGKGDPAVTDERDLDAALTRLARDINTAWRIVARYPVPARPDPVDRSGLGLIGPSDNACANCATIEGEAGGPRFEPTRSDLAGPTTVGGRLEVPMALCAWCYGCVRDWGRVPNTDELTRHHQGKRVGWPADVERPA